ATCMYLHSGVVQWVLSELHLPPDCSTDAYADLQGCSVSRVIPREGRVVMLVVCRGRIPAIILCTCAAIFAANAFAESASSPQAVATVGDDLLRDSENPRTIDTEWMLQDDRRTLPDDVSPAHLAPVAPQLLQNPSVNSRPQ